MKPAPDWAVPLEDDHVWCPECRDTLYLGEMEWPDPLMLEPGEVVEIFVSCYAGGDDPCDADVLVRRRVNAAGDDYDGPPVNVWPMEGDDG